MLDLRLFVFFEVVKRPFLARLRLQTYARTVLVGLAMRHTFHFILSCGEDPLRLRRQYVLRASATEEAVGREKPVSQPPAILVVAEGPPCRYPAAATLRLIRPCAKKMYCPTGAARPWGVSDRRASPSRRLRQVAIRDFQFVYAVGEESSSLKARCKIRLCSLFALSLGPRGSSSNR